MASDTTTFPLTGPIKLQVRLGYGSITVTAQDDPARRPSGSARGTVIAMSWIASLSGWRGRPCSSPDRTRVDWQT